MKSSSKVVLQSVVAGALITWGIAHIFPNITALGIFGAWFLISASAYGSLIKQTAAEATTDMAQTLADLKRENENLKKENAKKESGGDQVKVIPASVQPKKEPFSFLKLCGWVIGVFSLLFYLPAHLGNLNAQNDKSGVPTAPITQKVSPQNNPAIPELAKPPVAAQASVAPVPRLANPPVAAQAPAAPASPQLPRAEQDFIAAVQEGQNALPNAPNEMAQGGIRARRKNEICRLMPEPSAKNWIGTIDKLSANSDGKGVLSISIAKDISLETSNNDFSDSDTHTLIDPESPLFATVSAMKQGDTVMFSGLFFSSSTDCVREQSMTLTGSIGEPEFLFQFSAVSKP